LEENGVHGENHFLNSETFKSCDFIGYKESHWDLLNCFRNDPITTISMAADPRLMGGE
jgi:hypothetical protein